MKSLNKELSVDFDSVKQIEAIGYWLSQTKPHAEDDLKKGHGCHQDEPISV
jgi:hypothetical protein